MGVGALLGALIELLDDDDFFARLAALKDDGDLLTALECLSKREIFSYKFTFPGL